jgi:hypothetical protein
METVPPKRFCRKCEQFKPLTAFNKNSASPDGYRYDCTDCRVVASFDSRRRQMWRTRYGITPEEYASLLSHQNGVCAICERPETGKANNGATRLLAVDHCHKTGRIRGLLCGGCNYMLGVLEDTERLQKANRYLARHGT